MGSTQNPTLKNLCEKDPTYWNKYLNQVLISYHVTPYHTTVKTSFFLVYGRDPNLPLHQLLEPMQHFLGDPESGRLNLENHHLTLATAKRHWMNIISRMHRKQHGI